MKFTSIFLLIFLINLINYVNCQNAPPFAKVKVNKCCRLSEHLAKDLKNNGSNEELTFCEVGGVDKWLPEILRIARRTVYEPRGEAPKNFIINENQKPIGCRNPEYITKSHHQYMLFINGTLHSFSKSISIPPENYCIDYNSAIVCFPNSDNIKKLTKIKKCCGPNIVYDSTNNTCVLLKNEHKLVKPDILKSDNIEVLYGFPNCEKNAYAIVGKFNPEHFEDATGILTLDSGKHLQYTEYCLEQTLDDVVNVFSCKEHVTPPDEAVQVEVQDTRLVLFSIGLLISVIFLIATLAASFLVPSNHHVLHWRCQTHYVACLLVGDFLLAITQISGTNIAGPSCITIAIFMHFFFLAAFFWLNTMCFNIWWTFRDFRPTSLEKGQELCRLRIYEVYAWGVPLLIAGLAAILDNLPENSSETFLRPRFGEKKCWFYGDMEMLTYFFGPIGILLIINLMLFASTARQLTCGLWKRDDVKSTTERAALGRVCLKLVVVMGVTWCADVISWAVGGPDYVWIVTDLVNALQGVLIFIVVGCQPQVWSAVKRIWTAKTGRGMNTTTNGPQHSSSSHGLPSMGESVTNNTFTNTSTKMPMETIC